MDIIRRIGCLPTPANVQRPASTLGAPVIKSLPFRAPIDVYQALWADGQIDPFSVFLDGGFPGGGDFAAIAFNPVSTLSCKDGQLLRDGRAINASPFDIIGDWLSAFKADPLLDLPAFQGGIAGYWGYELGGLLENLPAPKPDDGDQIPDMMAGLFDTVITFDCIHRQAFVIAYDLPGFAGRLSALGRSKMVEDLWPAIKSAPPADWRAGSKVRAELTPGAYKAAVQKTIDYIYAGDIFQANITQRFLADNLGGPDGFTCYQRLRDITPAPYGAYLDLGEGRFLASASPECFLRLQQADGLVTTKPIKGTRPRAKDPIADQALGDELINSQKDRAENLMIVDLLRNDLSRVAEPGSVTVPALFQLESYPAVHHLVSTVQAKLADGLNAADLLRACFPGGSVTGAPKIRAMEIIHEIEIAPRGPYCGMIGWLGFSGGMESSIVIRTLVGTKDRYIAQAGCGIVADSEPEAEYQESMDKAAALIRAIEGGPNRDGLGEQKEKRG